VVLHAGWQGTATKPMELGKTNLKCRVFCHFGCSSYQHFRTILRHRKNWQKAGNTDKFAYFTTDIAYGITASFWLHRLLTYDKYNAFKPWEPSLEYARRRANADLKKWCMKQKVKIYRII